MIGLFFIPYLMTMNAIAYDGYVKIGFPLTVYSYGGYKPVRSFFLKNLVVDLIIVISMPFVLNLIFPYHIRNTKK